jgi:hypothetical protein
VDRLDSLNGRALFHPQIDGSIEAILKTKGWSSGAMACIQGGKTLFVVTCNRGRDWIIGKGETERAAWKDAAKQADEQADEQAD